MNQQHERAINAPWSVLTLIIVLLGGFAVQTLFGADQINDAWGFRPADLVNGPYATLLTSMFLHGSWAHVLGNAGFALAFATPVARRIGNDAIGVAAFFGFYLVCGLIANLGFAALAPLSLNPVVGASGAIAGMMGAATRLIGVDEGQLAPINSQPVIVMAVGWIAVNVVFAFLGGWAPGANGASVAWQVHLVGYAAGLFLFSPMLSLIGRRRAITV